MDRRSRALAAGLTGELGRDLETILARAGDGMATGVAAIDLEMDVVRGPATAAARQPAARIDVPEARRVAFRAEVRQTRRQFPAECTQYLHACGILVRAHVRDHQRKPVV